MHKGKIIEKAVRSNGVSITNLAKKMNRSRQWIYHIFESNQVSTDIIIEIGKAIHHDFSNDISSISNILKTKPTTNAASDNEGVEYWKQKYILLLEEYNNLLKRKTRK